jgi:hypothetical protein
MSTEIPEPNLSQVEKTQLARFQTARDRVVALLRQYPATRGNDTYLCWLYLKVYEGLAMPWIEYRRFFEFNFETIRRVRQKIQAEAFKTQEDGLDFLGDVPVNELLPTEEAALRRRRKQQTIKRVIGLVKEPSPQ